MIWIILDCINCDVTAARAQGWRADAVLVAPSPMGWMRTGTRAFDTRAACLRGLRRMLPESDWAPPDRFGQIVKITHEPDSVERVEAIPGVQTATITYGCFAREH